MSGDTEKTGGTGKTEQASGEGHGKRWLLVSVIVPITVALISAITVLIQNRLHATDSDTTTTTTASTTATVVALPPADPIPAAWCFDCNPNLITVARDCRDGSMHACDDLWKTIADPKVAEPTAIHDYGISCGGRRQLKSPGYQYKDCSDEFPGHY